MGIGGSLRFGLFAAALAAAGCSDTGASGKVGSGPVRASQPDAQDVETPKVFAAQEAGLWDGRPSLGGVWVAYPGVKSPERVLIRNTTNDRTVVGALFRRERDNPGPKIQVSSDAAAELGMLAGAPARLSVVALKRAETEAAPAAAKAAGGKPATPAQKTPAPQTAQAPLAAGETYIQIGSYGVEANAARTAERLRAQGLPAAVRAGSRRGKPVWGVLAGPGAAADLLQKAKALGYADAYAVKK